MAKLSATLVLIFLTALFFFSAAQARDSSHLVIDLPGQPSVDFRQYAGQVRVDRASGRALFYWFFEASHKNASSLPLAIWFNGGPGCSSVGFGALGELGPFRTNTAGTGLVLNDFAWNRVANLIFLESPHGVGFSYSNTSKDYKSYTDDQTASDVLKFILEWLKLFPEYSTSELYLTGESYAGHYVPTLAAKIIEHNRQAGLRHINLKGFAVGNPWTDAYYDSKGNMQFYHSHSMISDETFQQLIDNCDSANDLPVDNGSSDKLCSAAATRAFHDMAKIDMYNVYGLSCNSADKSKKKTLHLEMLTAAYDPCLDSVTPYLNSEKVQNALHVRVRPKKWSFCSAIALKNYPRSEIAKSMLPVYAHLLSEQLRIWIFSGDIDGVVTTTATRSWIKQLSLTVNEPWHAWNFKGQVGGWTQSYHPGFTFVSVRGAGHMVPFDKPEHALQVFKHFLDGKRMPTF